MAEIAIFTWKGNPYSITLVAYPDVANNDKATYASLQDGVEQIAGTIMDFLKDQ